MTRIMQQAITKSVIDAKCKPALIHQLPDEILLLIFYAAIPPSFLLDSSQSAGPNSPWCLTMRTKKSIIAVCRRWWQVGVEMFYEEVVFRQFGQIPALVRTLEDPMVNIGNLIKKIDIRCFIPIGYSSLYEAELRRVFEHCPRVARVNFSVSASPADPSTSPLRAHCVFRYLALQSIISKLTHLQCGPMVSFGNLVAGLQLCTDLVSLSFYLPSHDGPAPQEHEAFSISLVMAQLEDFRCVMAWRGTYYLSIIAQQWSMPRLRRASFDQNINVDMSYHARFFRSHGHNIQYLHIRPAAVILIDQATTVEMQVLLDLCPSVEHIVLSSQMRIPIAHPKVMWIDVWDPNSAQLAPYKELCATLTPKAFPALRGIRYIDLTLANVADVPIVLPPDLAKTGGAFEYRFPGVDVQHTVGRIVKRDMMYCHCDEDSHFQIPDDFDESESDNSGLDHSSDVNSSDTYLSDAELSDDHSSEYWSTSCDGLSRENSDTDDWADHDTALSIFLRKQD
jgi:hypothetical protein